MIKKFAIIVLLSSVLITGCSSYEPKAVIKETMIQESDHQETKQPLGEQEITQQGQITTATLIGSSEQGHVKMYAIKEEQHHIEGVTLDINGHQQDFDWHIPHTGAAGPQLFYSDLTGDGKEEAVVIINTGRGTELNQYDIHVINSSDFSEIKVPTYEEVVAEYISNSVTIIDDQTVDIKIQAQGKEYHFTSKVALPSDYNRSDLGFGGVYIYFIENQQIVLNIAASVGIWPQYVADVNATLKFDQTKNEFVVDQVDVKHDY